MLRDGVKLVKQDLGFENQYRDLGVPQGGEEQDLWYRTMMLLRKISGRRKIVCDHSSVLFYMDGNDRAALDLKP